MNGCHIAAGCLAILLGLAHSLLGEVMIFRRLRLEKPAGSKGAPPLGRPEARILRVTWHIATIFGWGLGAIILWAPYSLSPSPRQQFFELATALTFLACSMLTLIGTRGRHPGWIGLLIIALLLFLA